MLNDAMRRHPSMFATFRLSPAIRRDLRAAGPLRFVTIAGGRRVPVRGRARHRAARRHRQRVRDSGDVEPPAGGRHRAKAPR
jgi:hypothetical protein